MGTEQLLGNLGGVYCDVATADCDGIYGDEQRVLVTGSALADGLRGRGDVGVEDGGSALGVGAPEIVGADGAEQVEAENQVSVPGVDAS